MESTAQDPPPSSPSPGSADRDSPVANDDTRTSVSRPQRNSFLSFMYLSTAFFFFMNSGNNADLVAQDRGQRALLSLAYQLKNYTQWLNGTASNFSMPSQDLTLLPIVDAFVPWIGPLDDSSRSYFQNITGYITGDAKFYNLSDTPDWKNASSWEALIPPYMNGTNMTELAGRLGDVNWTAMNSVGLSLTEKESPHLEGLRSEFNIVHGRVEVADDAGNSVYLELEGVRYTENGSIYGMLEPQSKHIDIRLLPSVVPLSSQNATAHTIALEFASRLAKFRAALDQGTLDMNQGGEEGPQFNCPFELYAQVLPSNISLADMEVLESELEEPTGITLPHLPKLSLAGILVSKECGILYEFKETEGLKTQRFWQKVTTYAGISSLVNLTLLLLLTRQADASRTPAMLGRISRWTMLTQVIADCITAAAHITIGVLADGRPSLSLIAPAFLALLLVVNEMQFLTMIQQTQGPEDARNSPPVPRPSPPPPTATDGPTLPIATTAIATEPPLLPLHSRIWDSIRPEANARAWILALSLITILARLFVSTSFELYLLLAVYSFMWIPQIVRNTRRGGVSARPFSASYVLGTTAIRSFFPLYLFACPSGLGGLDTEPWRRAVFTFLFFSIGSVIVLLLQDKLGPRFMLPSSYSSVPTYNYHPHMPLPDPEAPEQSLGDCAICMDAIYVDPAAAASGVSGSRRSRSTERKEKGPMGSGGTTTDRRRIMGGVSGVVAAAAAQAVGARKSYSLAPCHHLFHTDCLEKWLAVKNICPHCRRPLPPLS